MGVSALFMSAVIGISKHINPVEFVIFDNGLGRRDSTIQTADGQRIKLIHFGARGGRRYYRPENVATMYMASRLGPMGAILNEGIRLIDSCTAVMDVSGGDSFSDIYGTARFDLVFLPKAIAINRNKPLILLPQTYGPYKSSKIRDLASSVIKKSAMAWARDTHSYETLKQLLGGRFESEIHRCGVDMAFSLPQSSAQHMLPTSIKSWLDNRSFDIPLIGFNVSGLIYNDPTGATNKYGLKSDYREVALCFLRKLLEETDSRIILISHVMDRPGHYESDLAACQNLKKTIGEQYESRVAVAPATLNQSQVKWLISNLDWFCGTRMHSTIAGLSSGIPTATISYSDKPKGVFEGCGQLSQVYDPRTSPASELINNLWHSFLSRENIRRSLAAALPLVMKKNHDQFKKIAEHIRSVNQGSIRR